MRKKIHIYISVALINFSFISNLRKQSLLCAATMFPCLYGGGGGGWGWRWGKNSWTTKTSVCIEKDFDKRDQITFNQSRQRVLLNGPIWARSKYVWPTIKAGKILRPRYDCYRPPDWLRKKRHSNANYSYQSLKIY